MFLQDACGREELVVTAASYITICLIKVDFFTSLYFVDSLPNFNATVPRVLELETRR